MLRDNYCIETNYQVGNIYVTPQVWKIHALLYTDGTFSSIKRAPPKSTNIRKSSTYLPSIPQILNEGRFDKQLVIHGNLFSKNTLGGYEKQILPGNKPTRDVHRALLYDLNYVRTNNYDCVTKRNNECMYE